MKTTITAFLAASAIVMFACGTPAWAGLTTVYDTTWGAGYAGPTGPEADLVSGLPINPTNFGGGGSGATDILDRYYTSWTRIQDFGVPSTQDDQLWWDLDGGALVRAIYTSSNLKLGYSTNESTGSPTTWLSDGGGGDLDTVGETATFNIIPNSDAFVWVIGGTVTRYSRQALNSGTDFMVAYRVYGKYNDPADHSAGSTSTPNTYVIGFEDGGDMDYQDFVAEVSSVAIPAPGAVLLGAMGLGMVGWLKRRADKKAEA